jgi:hypothetical protein
MFDISQNAILSSSGELIQYNAGFSCPAEYVHRTPVSFALGPFLVDTEDSDKGEILEASSTRIRFAQS